MSWEPHGYNAGNCTKVAEAASITSYTYDTADRLANIALPDTTTIAYGHDANGRRVKQTLGAATTNYL